MRGAEHIAAHCPGGTGRHEVVVLTCGQCLNDIVDESMMTKDKLIKMGLELKDVITKDRWEPSNKPDTNIDVEVICDNCRVTLDAQVAKLSSSPGTTKITMKVAPHMCGQPPTSRKSIVFTSRSNPRGDM